MTDTIPATLEEAINNLGQYGDVEVHHRLDDDNTDWWFIVNITEPNAHLRIMAWSHPPTWQAAYAEIMEKLK